MRSISIRFEPIFVLIIGRGHPSGLHSGRRKPCRYCIYFQFPRKTNVALYVTFRSLFAFGGRGGRPCPFWQPQYKSYHCKTSVWSCCACLLSCVLLHLMEGRNIANFRAATKHRISWAALLRRKYKKSSEIHECCNDRWFCLMFTIFTPLVLKIKVQQWQKERKER